MRVVRAAVLIGPSTALGRSRGAKGGCAIVTMRMPLFISTQK